MDALRVYWRQGCSSCVKVKEYLAGLGVEFESIDVGARPQAMDELREMGVRTVPVVARGRAYVFAQALEDVSRCACVQAPRAVCRISVVSRSVSASSRHEAACTQKVS